jgi:superfamily II DNA or RNA helicase
VGVGKTDVAIEWARMLGATRTLVVVRNAAKTQWANAILRRDPTADVTIVDGTTLDQYVQAQFPLGWIVAHWESLVLVPEAYTRRRWDAVILDEAHQTQNRKTERTGVVLNLKADARMAMTGHPYWRAPDQLFPILRFLHPERYRSYWLFFWLHVRATPRVFGGFDIEGPRRPKLLQWELSPFTLRRTKRRVWPHLPAITRTPRIVTLTTTGRREYEKLRKQFFAELKTLKGTRTLAIPSMLARTMRMRQYLVDPGLLDASEASVKYPELLALMDEIQQPIVVFSSFKQALKRFAVYAKRAGKRVAMVTGDVREREREHAKQRFLRGDVDALLVTLGAGSESMNYGKYGYISHLDLPWTARDLQQSEGRVDRPEEGTGALVPTTSHPIIVADSYEERMQEKLNSSHSGFKSVFTVDQLEDLFG